MSKPTFSVLGPLRQRRCADGCHPRRESQGKSGAWRPTRPIPIHGIDKALGLRQSPLGGMVLVMGMMGAISALAFEYWTSAIDYPLVTGGKPPFSWEAFVPIMFEVTVLFATFTAGLGMLLLLNRLPFFGHPVLARKAIPSITRDKFALPIEADRAALDVDAAHGRACREAGAADIEVLPTPDRRSVPHERLRAADVLGGIVACLRGVRAV